MRVQGQVTCLEVKQENKKKDHKLYICMYLYVMSHIHDVNCKSVNICVIVVGGTECVMYELLEQTTCS
jgi:hypothetical protein